MCIRDRLHELGHSFMALHEGVKVRSITLFFLGGFAQVERECPTPMGNLRVALAGPLVSIFLAIFLLNIVGLTDSTLCGAHAFSQKRLNICCSCFVINFFIIPCKPTFRERRSFPIGMKRLKLLSNTISDASLSNLFDIKCIFYFCNNINCRFIRSFSIISRRLYSKSFSKNNVCSCTFCLDISRYFFSYRNFIFFNNNF